MVSIKIGFSYFKREIIFCNPWFPLIFLLTFPLIFFLFLACVGRISTPSMEHIYTLRKSSFSIIIPKRSYLCQNSYLSKTQPPDTQSFSKVDSKTLESLRCHFQVCNPKFTQWMDFNWKQKFQKSGKLPSFISVLFKWIFQSQRVMNVQCCLNLNKLRFTASISSSHFLWVLKQNLKEIFSDF